MSGARSSYTEADVAAVMRGINGWHRWNAWAAHYFVDGEHLCSAQHTFAAGGMARGLPPVAPKPAPLSQWGKPFGRVCSRCLKLAKERGHVAA